jgi:hypothetical protein
MQAGGLHLVHPVLTHVGLSEGAIGGRRQLTDRRQLQQKDGGTHPDDFHFHGT